MISKNYKFEKKWRKRKVKEYSKGIYVKFKPEEVEILHNRMKEAGVQNMSAYIRKMALKTNNNNTNFNNIYLILSGSEETSLWIGYDGFQ
ncbi:hypothetical protein DXC93_03015 [Dorea formicigenerans]|jgi:hypothetical protein|uniref:Mobilization protein n=1 Tax=Dorea formicigenerans TaxID=39486 RepID=A0A3E4PZC1_9FIRM|nr:hypothetical protein DXC93_03015 [Dorea formicigenerans]